jgi:hypothetical protein
MALTISPAAFTSIVRCIKSDRKEAESSEQRRIPRVGLSGNVSIIPCSPRTARSPINVMAKDLSPSGIGLTHSTKMTSGEQFILYLPATESDPAKAILCSVTGWRPAGSQLFNIGANFIREIDLPQPSSPGFQPPSSLAESTDEQVLEVQRRLAEAALSD